MGKTSKYYDHNKIPYDKEFTFVLKPYGTGKNHVLKRYNYKFERIADYVMGSRMDKWVFGFIIFAYAYVIAQVIRWLVC